LITCAKCKKRMKRTTAGRRIGLVEGKSIYISDIHKCLICEAEILVSQYAGRAEIHLNQDEESLQMYDKIITMEKK